MKPVYLSAGVICTLFGVMEMFRDVGSMLGLVLIFIGLLILLMSRKKRGENTCHDDDLFFDGGDSGGE